MTHMQVYMQLNVRQMSPVQLILLVMVLWPTPMEEIININECNGTEHCHEHRVCQS